MLSVEKGRHNNVPINARLCLYCDNKCIEDEIHFITNCTFYDTERKDLFSKLDIISSLSNEDVFCQLLKSPDTATLTLLGKFISNCFKKRNS